MNTLILKIRKLHCSFPGHGGTVRAVDGLDLDVHARESLGIVGESGSGKSVSFLAVLGLVAPPGIVTADEILWHGQDIRQMSAATLRRLRGAEIALTLQDAMTALNPSLTVATQIEEMLAAHGTASKVERRARATELLALVGIADPARRLAAYPHELSGGLRQRVMIAVALACGPQLLIADEPTTALDVTVQAQVLDLMADLRARLDMALVLITHNLGVVAQHCDRVAVMYAGQIVEAGPTAAVIARPAHPYTSGLLASLPRLDRLDDILPPIPGRMPDPMHLPPGCRFAARCPAHAAECDVPQPMRPAGPGRQARCRLVA